MISAIILLFVVRSIERFLRQPLSQVRIQPQSRLLLGRRKKALFVSPSPDTASKRAKGIYETPKKCRVEKTGEISRFLAVWLAKRLFPSSGSKLTCHHVFTGQFRCRICVSQFRCNMKVHFSLGDDGRTPNMQRYLFMNQAKNVHRLRDLLDYKRANTHFSMLLP